MQTVNPQPMPEEYERKGFFARMRDGLFGVEEPEEEELAYGAAQAAGPQNQRKPQIPLRIQTARGGRVAVRLNAQVFEDAKLAADGLKSGEHQIVNLERATPQMAERIIDFLNGVCYAIDGTVERVGDKVYMFVPANITVEVDNGATAANAPRRPTFGEARE
jgi:cell division inhibitor SepF